MTDQPVTAKKLIKSIIKAIEDKKGQDIVELDLRHIANTVAGFFIVCNANSSTQVHSIADAIGIWRDIKIANGF
jgi:ribosome-associated protein